MFNQAGYHRSLAGEWLASNGKKPRILADAGQRLNAQARWGSIPAYSPLLRATWQAARATAAFHASSSCEVKCMVVLPVVSDGGKPPRSSH